MRYIGLKEKKTVTLTKKQFQELKIKEVSELFDEHKIIIERSKTEVRIWMLDRRLSQYHEYPRLTGFEKVVYTKAEVGYIEIPGNHPLAETLEKRFKRAFLK